MSLGWGISTCLGGVISKGLGASQGEDVVGAGGNRLVCVLNNMDSLTRKGSQKLDFRISSLFQCFDVL